MVPIEEYIAVQCFEDVPTEGSELATASTSQQPPQTLHITMPLLGHDIQMPGLTSRSGQNHCRKIFRELYFGYLNITFDENLIHDFSEFSLAIPSPECHVTTGWSEELQSGLV